MRSIKQFKYCKKIKMLIPYKVKYIYPRNLDCYPKPSPRFKECICIPNMICREKKECIKK
jgi:hypothetical protein